MTRISAKQATVLIASLFALSLGVFERRSLASSLILEHLGTVSKIQIVFSTAGLRYKTPSGINLDSLETAVYEAARSALEREGIQASNSSPQQLVISLLIQGDRPDAHNVYHILLELQEEAVLERKWTRKEENSVWVTSWTWSSLTCTASNLTSERILVEINDGVTELAQKIVQARPDDAKATEPAI